MAVQWPQAICWLNAGISALVAFVFIRVFNLSLTGAACVFLVVFVVLSLTGSSFGGIWNSGLWTTLPARRCLGAVADAAMFIATAVASWWLVVDVIGVPGLSIRVLTFITRRRPEDVQFVYFVMLIWTGMAFFVPFYGIARYKTLIGKVAAPFARLVRSRFVGMGGSSSFSGLFHDWAHRHRQGQLLLGGSMYSPGWIVGRSDDRHFITVATNRSGKGRSAIIPNLLTWPGSALVIDPKGQNAAVTAAARGHGGGRVKKGMGQSVRIVDPFGELKAQGVDLPAHRFNPLTALDPRRPRCGGANPPADGCARRAGPERQ